MKIFYMVSATYPYPSVMPDRCAAMNSMSDLELDMHLRRGSMTGIVSLVFFWIAES